MKNSITLLCVWATVLLLAGCDVKDPIYNTPHPDKGQITLTTDWTRRTTGVDIPANYTVASGEYMATVSDATNTLDRLFEPGVCHLRVYNTPERITVSGSVATVAGASGNVDGAGLFIQEMPGWLFTGVTETTIEADTDHTLTVAMQQQVRQLTLFIEPTGSTTDRIERIESYLSGVASTLDMDNGTHGTPLNVALAFSKVTEGANTGKWAATVRLLGVAGVQQKLDAKLYFAGDSPKPFTLTAKVTPEFTSDGLYNAADLFVYVNDTLWQKLAFEQDEYGNHRIVTVRTQGTSDDNNHDKIDAKSVYMKISSDTRTIASYYSLDKKEWHMVRLYRNEYPDQIYLGISSQCPQHGGCTSIIEDITLSHDNVGDFRMGE